MKLVFPRKPDAAPKKGIRCFGSVASTSVMSKWFATCVILRLEKDEEPEGWKQLHVGGIDGISCQRSCCKNTGSGMNTGGRTCGMAAKRDPRCTWLAWTSRRPSTWQDQKRTADGSQRPHYEKRQAWQDRQHLNMLKTHSLLRDASVRGALRHLGFGSKLQRRSCGMLSQNGREKKMGVHTDTCQRGENQTCSFMWVDIYWRLSHSKTYLQQMMMDMIDEAERCDLEPKLASLWWTSTDDDERMDDSEIRKTTGLHKLLFEKKKKILGYTFNQPGRTQDRLEERLQSVDRAWWIDVKIFRSKDVAWRVECKRIVEHVHIVFCFGSENWS